MPVYQFNLMAKVSICMDGATPEEAAANLESLMEDAYISNPHGFELKFGLYPSTIWVTADPPQLERQMPDGYDPKNPPRMTMKRWMEICLGDPDDLEEVDEVLSPEASQQVREMLDRAEGAKGQDLPLANKEDLLKKKDS